MVFLKAFAVWLLLLIVETVHAVFRMLVIEPWVGDFSARQISVFTGSLLILIVTYLFVEWIEAKTVHDLNLVGIMWVVLTFGFEVGMGRFVLAHSWERILSDFNLARGGLLGIPICVLPAKVV